MTTKGLILPGIGNSGPGHWQSLWEAANPCFARIHQHDWDCPTCSDWLASLRHILHVLGEDVVLVAHSLSCLLVAHWAVGEGRRVKGALLVAPPDPAGPNFPRTAVGFAPVPMRPLQFPSIVVASEDDPYAEPGFARNMADAWGSQLVNIGRAGHINADSGLGDWPQGWRLFKSLTG